MVKLPEVHLPSVSIPFTGNSRNSTPRRSTRSAKRESTGSANRESSGSVWTPPEGVWLSTWGEAIVAAATGDAPALTKLLAGEGNDGKGIDLRTHRTTWDDADFVKYARNIIIEPSYTLIEIAVERDHFECVMLLTAAPPEPPREAAAQGQQEPVNAQPPLMVRRAVSSFGPVDAADGLRSFLAEHLEVMSDAEPLAGLVELRLPAGRQTFLLPTDVISLPLEARQAACGMLLEDPYTQEGVEDAVGWWARALAAAAGVEAAALEAELALPAVGLHALYTSGDGNCLLHAALLSSFGVRDARIPSSDEPGACDAAELATRAPRRTLRAAVHFSLTRCAALRELLKHHGCELEGEPGSGADTLESRSCLHGNSCDPGHILLLAHILRRPIVCYASASVGEVREVDPPRTMSSYAARGDRMSGVYLPCLLPPEECARDPICIAFTQGHFSALVSGEPAADARIWRALGLEPPPAPAVPLPLIDEALNPLPVLFPPAGADEGADEGAAGADDGPNANAAPARLSPLLSSYLDVHLGTLDTDNGPRPIPLAAQRVPPPQSDEAAADPLGAASPADVYFENVWARRVAAARLPRQTSWRSTSSSENLPHSGSSDRHSSGVLPVRRPPAVHPAPDRASPIPRPTPLASAGRAEPRGLHELARGGAARALAGLLSGRREGRRGRGVGGRGGRRAGRRAGRGGGGHARRRELRRARRPHRDGHDGAAALRAGVCVGCALVERGSRETEWEVEMGGPVKKGWSGLDGQAAIRAEGE